MTEEELEYWYDECVESWVNTVEGEYLAIGGGPEVVAEVIRRINDSGAPPPLRTEYWGKVVALFK